MAQILVRNLDNSVKEALRKRAESRGVSLEEEVRLTLRNSVERGAPLAEGLGTRMARSFAGLGDDLELPSRDDWGFRDIEFGDE